MDDASKSLPRVTGLCRDEPCLGCIIGEYHTPKAIGISLEMRARLEGVRNEDGRIYEQLAEENQRVKVARIYVGIITGSKVHLDA